MRKSSRACLSLAETVLTSPGQTTRALKQIPFNGKKLKPAKLRKDYWRTLAMIEFGQGQELVGQSVFQRLVECKSVALRERTEDGGELPLAAPEHLFVRQPR